VPLSLCSGRLSRGANRFQAQVGASAIAGGPHAYCWTCCSVFTDWARGRVDDEVLPLASDVYASVVLTFIRRSAAKALSEKELAAIDRARELVIAGFGAQYLSGRSETCDRW